MSGRRRAQQPPRFPDLLEPVELTLHPLDGPPVVIASKLLDIVATGSGSTLVVARAPGDGAFPHVGHAAVSWTGVMGRFECPVTGRADQREYGPVWLLQPAGDIVRRQRRKYFRARMYVPVRLAWTVPGDGEADATEQRAAGVALDLSEGGLLATTRDPLPPVGGEVTATVRLDDIPLEHRATVVRHVSFPGGGVGVALAFDDPSRHGDRIRQAAFEAERRHLATRSVGPRD
jgi:hypothetical protein